MREGFHDQEVEPAMRDANPPKLTIAIDDAKGVVDVKFETRVGTRFLALDPYSMAELLSNRLHNAVRELMAGMKDTAR